MQPERYFCELNRHGVLIDAVNHAFEHHAPACEFRRNPATDSDLKPATVPI
jgi:hypothetical protein